MTPTGPVRKRVALFDADGVFLRVPNPLGRYLEHRHGLSNAQIANFRDMMSRCLIGESDLRIELPRLLKEWDLSVSAEGFLHEAFQFGTEIDAAVADVVKDMRDQGITCCLATNQEKQRMTFLDDHFKIRSYFDATFVSCELGARKPNKDFYCAVAARFPEHDLIFWDDSRENIDAARECGWTAFVFIDAVTLRSDLKRFLRPT
jgi:putative hydrolase of the HAD superfamily